jgi:flagellar biosynthesis GTPase FlhF
VDAPPNLSSLVSDATRSSNLKSSPPPTQSHSQQPQSQSQKQQYESVLKENQQLQKEFKDLSAQLTRALQERQRLRRKNEVLLKFLKNVHQEVDRLHKIEKYVFACVCTRDFLHNTTLPIKYSKKVLNLSSLFSPQFFVCVCACVENTLEFSTTSQRHLGRIFLRKWRDEHDATK